MSNQLKRKLCKLSKYLIDSKLEKESIEVMKLSNKVTVKITKQNIELGRFGSIFQSNTVIRGFIDEIFTSNKPNRDLMAKQIWIDEFLDKNSDILSNYDQVKHLGSGVYADAWETDDGRVIKFIKNSKDLEFYKEQIAKLHDGSGGKDSVMVYDAGTFEILLVLKSYDVRSISIMSWVVLEKLVSLRDFIREYDKQLELFVEFLKDANRFGSIKNEVLSVFKYAFGLMKTFIEHKVSEHSDGDVAFEVEKLFMQSDLYKNQVGPIFSSMEKRVGLPKNWIHNIINAMVIQFLEGNNDLHSGNVGFRGEQPVYFDPSNKRPEYTRQKPSFSPDSDSSSLDSLDAPASKTIIFDEPDETMDKESAGEFTNKTYDWEYR